MSCEKLVKKYPKLVRKLCIKNVFLVIIFQEIKIVDKTLRFLADFQQSFPRLFEVFTSSEHIFYPEFTGPITTTI